MAGIGRIAWRNLGRNRRRTFITGSALAVGIALSVATFGLTEGMMAGMLESLTRLDLGHVQLHHPEFPSSRAQRHTLPRADALLAELAADPAVEGVAPRLYGFALLAHQGKSIGAELVGVDPARETGVTELHERRVSGRYLDAEPTPWPRGRELTAEEQALDRRLTEDAEADALAEIEALTALDEAGSADPHPRPRSAGEGLADPGRRRGSGASEGHGAVGRGGGELATILSPPPERSPRVYIGTGLARTLDLEVGDTFHATTQTIDGASEQAFLAVGGIFETGTARFDRGRVYLHLTDLQRFLHLHGRVHELAVATTDPDQAPGFADRFAKRVPDQVLVRSWDTIRPELASMIELSRASTAIIVFIIFFVATLGVVNTMLMAVFERTRELGVLKAIGMSGRRIVALIVLETLLLVLLAAAVGTLVGLGLDLYLVHHGLDLRSVTEGVSVEGISMDPVLRARITATGLILPTVILAATCFLASFYPAIRAARLEPAVGMRQT